MHKFQFWNQNLDQEIYVKILQCQLRCRRGSAFRVNSGDVNRILIDCFSTIGCYYGCYYLRGLSELPAKGLLILIELASLFDGFIRLEPGPNAPPDGPRVFCMELGTGTEFIDTKLGVGSIPCCCYCGWLVLKSWSMMFLSDMSFSTDRFFDSVWGVLRRAP